MTALNIDEIVRFCKHYFSHPAWDEIEDPWIRVSFLPSRYLIQKSKARPKPEEHTIRRSKLLGPDGTGGAAAKIAAANERGWDIYYFCNQTDPSRLPYCTGDDIRKRLWLPLDLDYRLPLEPSELMSEFGLRASAIYSTSSRDGWPHHIILLGVDCAGQSEGELHFLARELCAVFGSDAIHNRSRILRMPGTWNWKRCEKVKGPDGKLVSGTPTAGELLETWGPHLWSYEEIADAIETFRTSQLSADLQLMGVKDYQRGGLAQGERGDFGGWRDALSRAEKNQWSVSEGGRHNALCSWGVQMAAARLPWRVVLENLQLLRVAAFEKPYDDDRDFERVVAGVQKKWEAIDAELDSLFAAPAEDAAAVGRGSDDIIALERDGAVFAGPAHSNLSPAAVEVIKNRPAVFDAELDTAHDPLPEWLEAAEDDDGDVQLSETRPASDAKTPEAVVGVVAMNESGAKAPQPAGPVKSEATPTAGHLVSVAGSKFKFGVYSATPSPVVPSPYIALGADSGTWNYISLFAERLSHRGEGESRDEWLTFLGKCLAAANLFTDDALGSATELGRLLADRLTWAGCCHGDNYAIPVRRRETLDYWAMVRLNEDQALVLVRDLINAVHNRVIEQRKAIEALPDVLASNTVRGKKKAKYTFAAKGELLNGTAKDVLLRAKTANLSRVINDHDRKVIAFQNGWLDLRQWEERINGESSPDEMVSALLECWHADPYLSDAELRAIKGVRSGLAWLRYVHSCTSCFDVEAAIRLLRGRGDPTAEDLSAAPTPLLDKFFSTPFPDDRDAWRCVLRIIGYCLLLDNPLQKYFYFEGVAGGGKGTIAEMILALVGSHNSSHVQIDRLLSDAWLGPLDGKTAVLIDEAESGDNRVHKKAMSELARVTGGNMVSARSLNHDARDIVCTQKFILTTNRGLEADDAAGQQKRRVVPINFARKPSGKIIERLFEKILRAEGVNIVTRATVELLTAWHYGVGMFREGLNSAALQAGEERFEDATGGLSRLLRNICVPSDVPDENLSSDLLTRICEIWIGGREHRKNPGNGLGKRIVSEIEALGLSYSGQNKILMPISERGIAQGFPRRSRGVRGCRLDTQALLGELDMSPEELLRNLWHKCRFAKKTWHVAEGTLDIDRALFVKIEEEKADSRWSDHEAEIQWDLKVKKEDLS